MAAERNTECPVEHTAADMVTSLVLEPAALGSSRACTAAAVAAAQQQACCGDVWTR
jgi:hypothetical protein